MYQILGNVRSGEALATPLELSNVTEEYTKVLYEEVGDVRRERERERPIERRSEYNLTNCQAYGFSMK